MEVTADEDSFALEVSEEQAALHFLMLAEPDARNDLLNRYLNAPPTGGPATWEVLTSSGPFPLTSLPRTVTVLGSSGVGVLA